MSDLQWDNVKEWFDPYENGSVPDVVVRDTTLADWQTLLELVRSQGWRCEYVLGDQPRSVPATGAELFKRDLDGWSGTLRVWPEPHLEWTVRAWSPGEVWGDVGLHEIQGQERLDAFCAFLRTLGTALGKRVLMYPEGDEKDPPILAYEVADDRVAFLAGPWQ